MGKLLPHPEPKTAGRRPSVPMKRNAGRKLTAHFHETEMVEEFDAYAKASKHNRTSAARFIFERELSERWLAKALVWVPRRLKIIG